MVAIPKTSLQIEPSARRYIAARGGHVYIRPSPRYGCCGGRAQVPVVDLGQPTVESDYRLVQVDGITVHIHKEMVLAKPVVIGAGGFGKWKRLWIEGAEMTM